MTPSRWSPTIVRWWPAAVVTGWVCSVVLTASLLGPRLPWPGMRNREAADPGSTCQPYENGRWERMSRAVGSQVRSAGEPAYTSRHMPAASALDLPVLDYLDPELIGARFHEVLAEARARDWLARTDIGYLV